MAKAVFALAAILGVALAARTPTKQISLAAHPMHKIYAQACGKRIPVSLSAHGSWVASQLHQPAIPVREKEPEAAPAASGPFGTVFKDGFFEVACVKDLLFSHGDKFGDNKFDYTPGRVANVTIIHYSEVVAKEDRKEMTQETCFEFCRTVPDMLYFGLIHGRDCYCAPFFKMVADDSSDCDEVCAAKPTQMCGGKTKSLLFEMHECADTAANLEAANKKAQVSFENLSAEVKAVTGMAEAMQSGAARLQDVFGQAGDPGASDLFQAAKVFAGELTHDAEDKAKIVEALDKALGEASGLEGADMQAFETNKHAEAVTKEMEQLNDAAARAMKDLDKQSHLASPVREESEGAPASEQYYPLMYFVDKKHEKDPSTCTGDVDKKPMVDVTIDECAHACDAAVHSCVGYSYFPADKFCFLFSKFTEVTYYTGCGGGGGGDFLQKGRQPATPIARKEPEAESQEAAAVPQCYGKLSEFPSSVAPNPSGKCAGCLKKATEAARCYE